MSGPVRELNARMASLQARLAKLNRLAQETKDETAPLVADVKSVVDIAERTIAEKGGVTIYLGTIDRFYKRAYMALDGQPPEGCVSGLSVLAKIKEALPKPPTVEGTQAFLARATDIANTLSSAAPAIAMFLKLLSPAPPAAEAEVAAATVRVLESELAAVEAKTAEMLAELGEDVSS